LFQSSARITERSNPARARSKTPLSPFQSSARITERSNFPPTLPPAGREHVSILSEDYGAFELVPRCSPCCSISCFNPQRGLRSVRTRCQRDVAHVERCGFNPQRGLRSVRTLKRPSVPVRFSSFNPQRGLRSVRTPGPRNQHARLLRVSILSEDYGAFELCYPDPRLQKGRSFNPQRGLRSVRTLDAGSRRPANADVSILSEDYGAFERFQLAPIGAARKEFQSSARITERSNSIFQSSLNVAVRKSFQSSARITERSNSAWRSAKSREISKVSILSEDYGAFEHLPESQERVRLVPFQSSARITERSNFAAQRVPKAQQACVSILSEDYGAFEPRPCQLSCGKCERFQSSARITERSN